RRQPRHVEEAAHDRRVVDLLVDRPGGMRPLRRRSRHRCRGAVHPSLVARPGRRGLQIVRHADDQQRRVPVVVAGAMNDLTITPVAVRVREYMKAWGIKATSIWTHFDDSANEWWSFWDGVPPTWQPRFGGALLFLEACPFRKFHPACKGSRGRP